MAIYSCMGCEKRHPGCHAECETYKREKAAHDEQKAAEDRRRAVSMGITEQRTAAVAKAMRKRKKRSQSGKRKVIE